MNTYAYALQNPLRFSDPTGLSVYECWLGLHPSIKIESNSSCNAPEKDFNGQWGFQPAEDEILSRVGKAVWWQRGAIWDEAGGACRIVFADDNMDQFIFERIMQEKADPPAYHLVWFNSVMWSNYILTTGNSISHELARSARHVAF